MSILSTINECDGGDMRVRVRMDEILGSIDFTFPSLAFPAVMYFAVFDVFFDIFSSSIFAFDISQSMYSRGNVESKLVITTHMRLEIVTFCLVSENPAFS